MQCPLTSPGVNWQKFHFVPAAAMTSIVSMSRLWQIAENSFMSAMFTSRWVFSMILAASATLIEAHGEGGNNRTVDGGDNVECLLVLPRDHLRDGLETMRAVADIDAFRRISDGKIPTAAKTGRALKHWNAVPLGGARIDCRFINNDVARAKARVRPFPKPVAATTDRGGALRRWELERRSRKNPRPPNPPASRKNLNCRARGPRHPTDRYDRHHHAMSQCDRIDVESDDRRAGPSESTATGRPT